VLLNLRAQISFDEVRAPFPTSSWLQQGGPTPQLSFAEVLEGFLTRGVAATQLDDLGWSLISYTLYRCVRSERRR
jgi:hypothetical protein